MDDAAQTFVKEHFSTLQQARILLEGFDKAIDAQGREAVCRGLGEDVEIRTGSATWGTTKVRRFFPASWGGKSQLVLAYRPDQERAKDGMLGWFVRAYLHAEEFDFVQLREKFESLSETHAAFHPASSNAPKGTWTEGQLLALDAWPSTYTHAGALEALEALACWINKQSSPRLKAD